MKPNKILLLILATVFAISLSSKTAYSDNTFKTIKERKIACLEIFKESANYSIWMASKAKLCEGELKNGSPKENCTTLLSGYIAHTIYGDYLAKQLDELDYKSLVENHFNKTEKLKFDEYLNTMTTNDSRFYNTIFRLQQIYLGARYSDYIYKGKKFSPHPQIRLPKL